MPEAAYDMRRRAAPPIFILGIMPRSGTNFLHDLLLLHPSCRGSLLAEDYLTAHSDLLVRYAESTVSHWSPRWQAKKTWTHPERVLAEYIGHGLISFLDSTNGDEASSDDVGASSQLRAQRTVTKTPSIRNLDHFAQLFPHAQLLVLVRDGRSVVASGMVSFHWNFEKQAHVWANSVQTVLEFAGRSSGIDGRYLIVRYEDLYRRTKAEMRRILAFLHLPAACYDFEQAAKLPVRGSSQEHRKGEGNRHWDPVARSPDFDPLRRWSDWSEARKRRFNWIAGDYLARLGYGQADELAVSAFWRSVNWVLEVKYAMRVVLARLRRLIPVPLRPKTRT